MSRQLSCRDMCEIVIWLDHYNHNDSKDNFHKNQILISLNLGEMGPWNRWMFIFTTSMGQTYRTDEPMFIGEPSSLWCFIYQLFCTRCAGNPIMSHGCRIFAAALQTITIHLNQFTFNVTRDFVVFSNHFVKCLLSENVFEIFNSHKIWKKMCVLQGWF